MKNKTFITSIIGVIISIIMAATRLDDIGLNPWVAAFILFGLNAILSHFFPTDGFILGEVVSRNTFTAVNVILFLIAIAGWLIDNPQIVDGVAQWPINRSVLVLIGAGLTAILRLFTAPQQS